MEENSPIRMKHALDFLMGYIAHTGHSVVLN